MSSLYHVGTSSWIGSAVTAAVFLGLLALRWLPPSPSGPPGGPAGEAAPSDHSLTEPPSRWRFPGANGLKAFSQESVSWPTETQAVILKASQTAERPLLPSAPPDTAVGQVSSPLRAYLEHQAQWIRLEQAALAPGSPAPPSGPGGEPAKLQL